MTHFERTLNRFLRNFTRHFEKFKEIQEEIDACGEQLSPNEWTDKRDEQAHRRLRRLLYRQERHVDTYSHALQSLSKYITRQERRSPQDNRIHLFSGFLSRTLPVLQSIYHIIQKEHEQAEPGKLSKLYYFARKEEKKVIEESLYPLLQEFINLLESHGVRNEPLEAIAAGSRRTLKIPGMANAAASILLVLGLFTTACTQEVSSLKELGKGEGERSAQQIARQREFLKAGKQAVLQPAKQDPTQFALSKHARFQTVSVLVYLNGAWTECQVRMDVEYPVIKHNEEWVQIDVDSTGMVLDPSRHNGFFVHRQHVALLDPAAAYEIEPPIAHDLSMLLTDEEFTNHKSMTVEQIRVFLQGQASFQPEFSALITRGYLLTHIPGVKLPELIHAVCQPVGGIGLNPKILLALLQKEKGLVESTSEHPPSQEALDWALGAGATDKGKIKKHGGFENQIKGAADILRKYFREGLKKRYPLKMRGINYDGKGGPDTVEVKNAATYALYKYTPHTHGSSLFLQVYDKYSKAIYAYQSRVSRSKQ